jgi:hypothetical protein
LHRSWMGSARSADLIVANHLEETAVNKTKWRKLYL